MKQIALDSRNLTYISGGLGGGIEISGESLMKSWVALQLTLKATQQDELKPLELVNIFKQIRYSL